MSSLTEQRRARLYLDTHRDAHYTNLPAATRRAKEDILAQLRREDPGVEARAMHGTATHLGPLSGADREYQRHMRETAGISEAEHQAARRKLGHHQQAPASPRPARSPARGAVRAGAHGTRVSYRTRRAARQAYRSTGAPETGSIVLESLGVGVGLAAAYLILSPNGSTAFSTLLKLIGNGLQILIGPVDPLNPAAAGAPYGGKTADQLRQAQLQKRVPAAAAPQLPGARLPSYTSLVQQGLVAGPPNPALVSKHANPTH